jgi:hypothetical protein
VVCVFPAPPPSSSFPPSCRIIQFICAVFVLSWTGVVQFHGVRPTALSGKSPGACACVSLVVFVLAATQLRAAHTLRVRGRAVLTGVCCPDRWCRCECRGVCGQPHLHD